MISSAYTSLCLKLMGVIFILSFLLDVITFAIPFQWQNSQWQISFVTTIVDRGVVPLVAMAMILIGYWIDNASGVVAKKSSLLSLKLPVFILASLLGLVFLLLVPVHLNNLNRAQATALEQIQQGVGQGEQQINAFLTQLNSISQNPQQLSGQIQQFQQILETGTFQGQQLSAQQLEQLKRQNDQLKGLRDLAQNPQDFKKRVEEIKNQLQTQLNKRQQNAESRAKTEALKQGLRIGLSSLMLAIVYSAIGWLGIRNVFTASPKEGRR
ncbi:conserved hypothetical protein [Gloeothece citriformis PCC 7424]|uniref:Uncharacterized protein n=1 Tax=Gloeothece citriformis (strain PCC 7424) TaxID=65393 RepID=B7KFR6_GLOC7|nr:HpsJ family protein [Gloeothece citriformis]ACK73391.1 conserved hypothetical protein [Gloeothece citriformis PCC 7424]